MCGSRTDPISATLIPSWATVSPGSTAAYYTKGYGDRRPGAVCGSKTGDGFVVSTVANLSARLDVGRLPANNGLRLSGTASDRNLDRVQLDFASQADPGTWHPIGPAFDAPVVDDTFATWVPPAPGTYAVRLSVNDRAGNARAVTRVVSWDRMPSLANFTQSEYFVSPNGDNVKDDVTFRYLVIEPTRLEVRIVGPEPMAGDTQAPLTVRRASFEYPLTGPQSFTWDGRDDGDQVVPDGRYTVYLNDLPFRVEIDNSPPEVDLGFGDAVVDPTTYDPGFQCLSPVPEAPSSRSVTLGSLSGTRSWHVVDRHLRSWTVRSASTEIGQGSGTDPVYVPETDANGRPSSTTASRACAGRTDTRRAGST